MFSYLLAFSLGLNGLFISFFSLKSAYNYYITNVAKKQIKISVDRAMQRYSESSIEGSPEFSRTVDQFNRVLRLIVPELNLPNDMTSEQSKLYTREIINFLFRSIRPDLIYFRYKFLTYPAEIQNFIQQLYLRFEEIDLGYIATHMSKIIEHPEPVSSYLLKCQYGDLLNITNQVDASNKEAYYFSLCCGNINQNQDFCDICHQNNLRHIKPELLRKISSRLVAFDHHVCNVTLEPLEDITKIGILTCGHFSKYQALHKWVELQYGCYNRCTIEPWISFD